MRRASFLVVILFLAIPSSVTGQGSPLHTMTKAEFGAFLDNLNSNVPTWRASISKIDASSLHLSSYENGRNIEDMKNMCLKSLDELEVTFSALSKKNELAIQIMLLNDLSRLRSMTGVLTVVLAGHGATQEERLDVPKIRLWEDGLKEMTNNQMKAIEDRLYTHLLALAVVVDSKIDVSILSL
jgi:hypothetical protein